MVAGIRRRGVNGEWGVVPVYDESLLCTEFPAVNWTKVIGVAAAEIGGHDAVDSRQFGFDDASLPEQREKVQVEIVPRPAFVGSSKTAVGGVARTAVFEWHVLPSRSGHRNAPEDLITAR